uniref:Peptidase C14 caspase domain-containing protein n=1 Tax=Vannella robusta TaxID=1487602 RepID=A0A7S4I5H8_9EUKA|mmetsp:Transcript_20810/g.26318  ORF Transcript_20810/g.26318 Transcript_20810/m.26318 type:complete len:365 (+) Transcript_20810:16-1110(+)
MGKLSLHSAVDKVKGSLASDGDSAELKETGMQFITEVGPKIVKKKIEETEDVPLPPKEIKNRKALVIGINYSVLPPGAGQLKGCINDANNVKEFLVGHNFNRDDIRLLTDDNQHDGLPTKEKLIASMKWLVEGAQEGDSLFFHYSGHGGQEKDETGVEEDGMNETIMPVDFQQSGHITDDDIHDILVKPLPAGVRLTAIFDSCHSQTVMDLPYVYHSKEDEYKTAHKKDDGGIVGRHVELKEEVANPAKFKNSILKHIHDEVKHQTTKHTRRQICEEINTSKALVMMIAGCRDDQTSVDTSFSGEVTGAMSYAFIKVLNEDVNQTWATLIKKMRDTLHKGDKKFEQMPQLSMGRPVSPDLDVLF